MSGMTVVLVRHAQEDRLPPARDMWRRGGGLTALGQQQARRTAERLRELPLRAIHSSTLPRAVQTAEIIAESFPDVPWERSPALCEAIPCPPAHIDLAQRGPDQHRLDADRMAADRSRALQAFERYFAGPRGDDAVELIVTHGNLIRYFVCLALGVAESTWGSFIIANASITQVVSYGGGRQSLLSFNDVGHLPRTLVTLL